MGNNNNSIIPQLREVEIFSNLDEDVLSDLSKNMKEITIEKGETLFNKGDQEHAMFIIVDGSVQVHDNEYIFTTLNNKQFFGEYSLVDSSVRSATVTAARDSKLLELDQKSFDDVIEKKPEVWKNILIALIKRLRDYNILEEKLTHRTLEIKKKKYELEKEKEAITKQKKELETINSTKDKFFNIIAHDLKTPFECIHLITGSLKKDFEQLNKDQLLTHIDQVNRFSINAYNLLDKLLQWAQSQTGSMKINFKRTNLLKVINEVVELYEGTLALNNLTIKTNVNNEIFGYFDINMITMVYRNILANAIAYSKPNKNIFISAEENNDMIIAEVRDEGIGMDKAVFDSLFKIENRKEMDTTGDYADTGLGLIICKDFILKNGGEIWAESTKNKGTSIKFTIPKAL